MMLYARGYDTVNVHREIRGIKHHIFNNIIKNDGKDAGTIKKL